MQHREVQPVQNVRRALHRLRLRWDSHSPVSPFCLAEEVEQGVTYSDLCMSMLLTHRSRRPQAAAAGSSVTAKTPTTQTATPTVSEPPAREAREATAASAAPPAAPTRRLRSSGPAPS